MSYELYLQDGSRGDELWDLVAKAGEKFNIKPAALCLYSSEEVFAGTQATGQGHETAWTQIIVEKLGVNPEDVSVHFGIHLDQFAVAMG